jgi:hypothetical protein
MRSLVKFFTLPLREQRDILEAMLSLATARVLLLLPFRWLAPFIGQPHPATDHAIRVYDSNETSSALTVRRAILRVSQRMPWHLSCLVRAIAAQMMLRRRRLPSVLHLGVLVRNRTELCAHAWLRCGDIDVVGAEIAGDYTPIAAFCE